MIDELAMPAPKLPAVMLEEVRMRALRYAHWTSRPLVFEERAAVSRAKITLLERLEPADTETIDSLVIELLQRVGHPDESPKAMMAKGLAEFSKVHIASAMKACLANTENQLTLRRIRAAAFERCCTSKVMLYRARVLLGEIEPAWHETPVFRAQREIRQSQSRNAHG